MPDFANEPAQWTEAGTRRRWLARALVGGLAAWPSRAQEPKPAAKARGLTSPSATPYATILGRAQAAKLRGFRSSESDHFLGIGDAPDAFREKALRICKLLASDYLRHFREKGFRVDFPDRKLTVITLKDRGSYRAFLGEAPGADVGGHYDLDANELVIFDFRPDDPGEEAPAGAPPERLNTFTLVHESLHQLTFNTGVLDRDGDVPVAVAEGLAMYGEFWRPTNQRMPLGQINKNRLEALRHEQGQGAEWIPIDRLLTEDGLFSEAKVQQLAYAQAWLAVHFLMSRPRIARFRNYLGAIRERRRSTQRLADAKAHLGDLARLDGEIRHRAEQLG